MKRKTFLPVGSFGQRLHKLFTRDIKSGEDSFVSKAYGNTEDSFFEGINEKLKTVLNLDKSDEESYKKDIKRFGTRIGLIEVADDAVPNKRRSVLLPLKKPFKPKRFHEKYDEDLKRYGTKQGIIHVANDQVRKKKKKAHALDFSQEVYNRMMNKWKLREATPFSANPFSDIFREFPKLQVTIHNKSREEKEVLLWGANKNSSVSPPAPADVQDHTITSQISAPAGIHPQGIVFNPFNKFIYVANQLSGTVTVIDSANQVVKVIQLEPTFPGFTSPVALAVNTKSTSRGYGFVYVVCSVANTLAVIDLSLNVTATLPVGIRPVAVAFNPENLQIYVANLVSDSMSVIEAEPLTEVYGSPFPTGGDPIGIGVNPTNGDIYVANSLDNSISVYDRTDALVTTIPAMGQRPVSVTYNPANNTMYAVATDSNSVYQINPETYNIDAEIETGSKPYNSFFNSANNFLYVQNREDNTFTVIKPDNSKIDGISPGEQNIGGAYNSANNSIYVSDTTNNTINIIGYLPVSSSVSVNPDYSEMREEFKSNPAIIQHTKFVVTGLERINSFRLNQFTPTGSVKSKPVSFELYASPQSKLNVSEVFELAGTVIDGKMNWSFKLPGMHSVSILIWYRQFEVIDIL